MKEIHIQPVLNGFIVKIGCQKVVFITIDNLCRELKRYHLDPFQVEKEYRESAINKNCEEPPLVEIVSAGQPRDGISVGEGRRTPLGS